MNRLKQKASTRNPDEFYFGMHNSEVNNGKHRKTQDAKQKEFDTAIGHETIRIMKDQDLSYIRMQRAKDRKKVEKLQASLQLGGVEEEEEVKRTHTIFVDSEKEAKEFDAAKHFDTLPELVQRTHNRPRVALLRKMALEGIKEEDGGSKSLDRQQQKQAELDKSNARQLAKARAATNKEMKVRVERVRAMEKAEAHLLTEKLVSSKGRKRKIQGERNGMPAQYIWRTKRLK